MQSYATEGVVRSGTYLWRLTMACDQQTGVARFYFTEVARRAGAFETKER